jgi:beta-lactamase superfamily II metal-dependent hydrolase
MFTWRYLVARGTAILREEAGGTSTEDVSGMRYDVIAPPTDAEGGLFSEINDNSVAIMLTYGTARILLAGDAEANEEEYMANGPYTGPLTIINIPKLHTTRA